MKPRYDYGDEVRVIRNVRNDGTFPGLEVGELLVRRGSVGFVRDIGTFLQDQLIYAVHFVDADRTVGCREQEIQVATAPWTANRFEFRDKVTPRVPLGIDGAVVVEVGVVGEIQRVLRDATGGVAYHVRLLGRTWQVPESALDAADPALS